MVFDKSAKEGVKLRGIVVNIKSYGEKSMLVSILCEDSCYVRAWVEDAVHLHQGQQIAGTMYVRSSGNKLFIDSYDNSFTAVFLSDAKRLINLNRMLDLTKLLPENIVFHGLYEKFVEVATLLGHENTLNQWEEYVYGLVE